MTYKIVYEIRIDNDGRPYVHLPEEFDDIAEHRFFSMEMTRYILQEVLRNNIQKPQHLKISQSAMDVLEATAQSIGNISDEMALIIKTSMVNNIPINNIFKNIKFDITVYSKPDLENILKVFLYNNKFYVRKNNIKVLVIDELTIYQLNWENIDDPQWVDISSIKKPENNEEGSENETQK